MQGCHTLLRISVLHIFLLTILIKFNTLCLLLLKKKVNDKIVLFLNFFPIFNWNF